MEEALQEGGDEASPILRFEAPFLQPYVAAVLQYPQDAGVGRGPADAEFLHLLDQARLGVARRRLREMLFGRNVFERDALALLHRRQATVAGFVLGTVVAAFLKEQLGRAPWRESVWKDV